MAERIDAILTVASGEAGGPLARRLREAGLVVAEAATGREALDLARGGAALLVLDGDLPDLDRVELLMGHLVGFYRSRAAADRPGPSADPADSGAGGDRRKATG